MGRPMLPRDERRCVSCGRRFSIERWSPKRYCGKSCSGKANKAKAPDMHGANNPRFNGGLSTSEGRTIIVCRDYTWIFYYRGVMMAHLGRELHEDEIVHHINGDPTDDRIENLQLTTRANHIEMHRGDLVEASRKARA